MKTSRLIGASSWVLDPNRSAGFTVAHAVAHARLGQRFARLGLPTPTVRAETHLVQVGCRYLLVAVAPAVSA